MERNDIVLVGACLLRMLHHLHQGYWQRFSVHDVTTREEPTQISH